MKQYQHTQIGYLLLAALGAGMLLVLSLLAASSFNWAGLVVLVILAVCLVVFASLTVEIDERALVVRFGPGLVRKAFALNDIETYELVKNPWYYGWGIHWTPSGWLFNVSGSSAVELRMRNGKRYRIGTDDPQGLRKALQEALHRRLS
jgi:hypothetical protein